MAKSIGVYDPTTKKHSTTTGTQDGAGRTAMDVSLISGGAENVDDDGAAAPSKAGLTGGLVAVAQRAAEAAGDLMSMTVNAFGELVVSGYDWSNNLIKTQEQNPLSEQYVDSELVDDTSVAADTYEYVLDMGGYKGLSLTFNLDAGAGGTVDLKVYVTNDDDATPEWVEVTGSGVDGSDASVGNTWQDTGAGTTGSLSWDSLNFSKVKVEAVVATAAADQLSIWARQVAL
jgi:hypothetical protein